MAGIISLILGGGQGTRLFPLTQHRSKPAVPVGGKHRLVDIPISNCLNSGLNQVYVLTQSASVSLHRHISNTYKFDPFHHAFVELLAAQQTLTSKSWYQGTADAVRQNLARVVDEKADHVLILSGDQLYRMDFRDLVKTHLTTGADATICTIPVRREDALGFGILQVDARGRIVAFSEKPKEPEVLERLKVPAEQWRAIGIEPRGRELWANMGIYLFRASVLIDLLEKTQHVDFGKDVFPSMLKSHHLQTHLFDGYWEDLGTIGSFHKANIDLASEHPQFEFHVPGGVIYTRARFLPGSRVVGAKVSECLIGDGAIVERDAILEKTVLGVRSRIASGVELRECVVLGADFYESDAEKADNRLKGIPDVGIGKDSKLERAIVDKNCRIGAGVQIRAMSDRPESESELWVIRDGIVVIPKGAIIPDGTVI